MTDKLMFRHWTEYNGEKKTSLILYNIESNYYQLLAQSELLSENFMLGGDVKFSISPDSKEVCYVSNPDPDIASSTNSDLMVLNIATGKTADLTKDNKAWDGNPVYSPNGFFIAFNMQTIPGYESDRMRLAIYNRSTKSITVLTDSFDNWVENFKWGDDSETLYFNADVEGYLPLYSINVHTLKITPLSGKQAVISFDVTPDQKQVYYTASAVQKPTEIYRVNTSDNLIQQMTSFNQKLLDEVDVRPAEQMWVEGADGKKVHVFVVKPHDFNAS